MEALLCFTHCRLLVFVCDYSYRYSTILEQQNYSGRESDYAFMVCVCMCMHMHACMYVCRRCRLVLRWHLSFHSNRFFPPLLTLCRFVCVVV
jgi:hypothetical protein